MRMLRIEGQDNKNDVNDSTTRSSNRQSITTECPGSGRVPIIDTREGTTCECTFTYYNC